MGDAGAGIGNPLGAVQPFDFGIPKIIPGYARTNLSGGVFAFGSAATGLFSSGLASYITTDIDFVGNASGAQFNGIVLQSVGSNTPVAIITEGVFIVVSDGTTTNGYPIQTRGNNAVLDLVGSASAINFPIGRALSSAGSEEYCLVHIRA
jgi:hypothetical protein